LLRNHIADPDRLLEFRKPTYTQPNANIKMRAFNILPSMNPLIKEQRAHEVCIGSKAARAGKSKSKPKPSQKAGILGLYRVFAVDRHTHAVWPVWLNGRVFARDP